MANSAQARKRARQASAQRDSNMSQRSEFRTAIKKVRKAIDAGTLPELLRKWDAEDARFLQQRAPYLLYR